MWDSLEKLFVSCLVLFGLFILFLFGLYFDLGEILASSFRQDEKAATGVGQTEELIRRMERAAMPKEIQPTKLATPQGGGQGPSPETERAILRRYCKIAPIPNGADLAAIRRRQLIKAGFARDDFIEMEALAEDRDEFRRVMSDIQRLMFEKRWPDAIRRTQEALAALQPANHLLRKEYQGLLVQLYLESRQLDRAMDAAKQLNDTIERVTMIRSASAKESNRAEADQQIATLKEEKARIEEMFQDLQKRQAENGTPFGLTASEKNGIRDAITKARKENKITEEEYRRTLKELEG